MRLFYARPKKSDEQAFEFIKNNPADLLIIDMIMDREWTD